MNPRQRQQRIYQKRGRWYGDFRDYRDVGGKLEALKPEGESGATTSRDIAEMLAANRLTELRGLRSDRNLYGHDHRAQLARFASHHLTEKAKSPRNYSESYLSDTQYRLQQAIEHFGKHTNLNEVTPTHITAWAAELGETLSPQTVLHYLNAFSNMYRRAVSEGVVRRTNPVAAIIDKPTVDAEEAVFLEVHEAATLLQTAERSPVYPILATILLTGARKREAFGLLVRDVNFDRRTVRIWSNEHRSLKTKPSHRIVPLWPQLHEILKAYLAAQEEVDLNGLLFPSPRTGRMRHDMRKTLGKIASAAKLPQAASGKVHIYRHTYCTARLQTLDHGAPIAESTVVREMGHESPELVRRIYGHLGTIRHRAEVVEYRVTNPVTNEADAGGREARA